MTPEKFNLKKDILWLRRSDRFRRDSIVFVEVLFIFTENKEVQLIKRINYTKMSTILERFTLKTRLVRSDLSFVVLSNENVDTIIWFIFFVDFVYHEGL